MQTVAGLLTAFGVQDPLLPFLPLSEILKRHIHGHPAEGCISQSP